MRHVQDFVTTIHSNAIYERKKKNWQQQLKYTIATPKKISRQQQSPSANRMQRNEFLFRRFFLCWPITCLFPFWTITFGRVTSQKHRHLFSARISILLACNFHDSLAVCRDISHVSLLSIAIFHTTRLPANTTICIRTHKDPSTVLTYRFPAICIFAAAF